MAVAQRIKWWVGFPLLALLAVAISVASSRFWTFDPTVLTAELRQNLLDHPVLFFTHTTFAPIALLIGVWQFIPATRRGWWHRWAGRLYVVSVLLSSVSGFAVAFTTEAGPVAAAGFAILAVLWFGATYKAYSAVRARDFITHRRWMVRSYALTCAAISLRIILPVGMVSGLEFMHAYWIAAWGCWIINLAIAELLLLRVPPTQTVSA